MSDGGSGRASCSWVRPAHFHRKVSRWKSRKARSVVSSSARSGGSTRSSREKTWGAPSSTSLTGLTVDRLADQVGVAVVAGVLLDHVHEDPAEAEGGVLVATLPLRLLVETTVREGLVDDRIGSVDGLVEERTQLLRGVVLRAVPLPVAVGVPVDGVERRHVRAPGEDRLEPARLH